MSRPRVSVIVPLYESRRTVVEAVESALSQGIDDCEVIVVDDGSTDGGGEVVEEAFESEARVRVIRRKNGGTAAARNTGLDHASGEFFYFLDADDWIAPGGLEALLGAAAESEHGAAFGAYAFRSDSGGRYRESMQITSPIVGLEQFLEFNRFSVHAQIIHRDTLGAHRFREDIRVVEDYDLWLKLAMEGVYWVATPYPVCGYRLRPGSLSKNSKAMFFTLKLILTDAYERARRMGHVSATPERLRRVLELHALNHATETVLKDPTPTKDRAAEIVSFLEESPIFTPEKVARAAHWCVPYNECRTYAAWDEELPNYWPPVRRWWARCESEGWLEPGGAEEATRLLASFMVDTDLIVDRIVEIAGDDSPIVLLGLGANGVAMSEVLRTRGTPFSACDDSLGWRRQWNGVRILPRDEAFSTSATFVMTPDNDGQFLASLPEHVRPIRWRDVRAELASDRLAALNACGGGALAAPSV